MILELLIFLVTTLGVYYWYRHKQIHWFFEKKDVRYLPGIPVLGNLYQSTFQKRHFIEDLYEVYRAFPNEKYVGLVDVLNPTLIIRDPELIKNITVKDFDHFVDHKEFLNEETDPLFGGSLFGMKGDRWRDMRTTLSPAFTSSKMRHILPFMTEISKNVIDYLKEHQSENVNVDDLMRRYTNDVIASAGFGINVNSVKDRENEFYKVASNIFNFSLMTKIFLVINAQFPWLSKKLGGRMFPKKLHEFFTNIISSTMEYRRKEKVERPDMIQLLMETPKQWTADELTAQVFIFFIAGYETSAAVLVMTIHELALKTKVQDKLYQEIKKHKEEKELHFDNLGELKYLECVYNETLRKWSPAIFMDRVCIKPYELPPPREGGRPYTLKPGDVVYNMVNCLHMDPKYYPEPEVYDPERFSEENKHKIIPYTFSPFGSGPRICIGMRFAHMQIKVLLYHLIANFKIVKCEKTSDPIKLKAHSFNIAAMDGTWVQFQKRE